MKQAPILHLGAWLATLVMAVGALWPADSAAQPVQRSANGKIAESYIKKVMAANGANSPVPVPTAAEVAALASFNARVNASEELEIVNWPPTPLRSVKSVGQLNGLMGQLENKGIYKTRAESNAKDATRKEQLAKVKTRSESLGQTGGLAKEIRITLSADEDWALKKLGYRLNENNDIVVGDKTFTLADAEAIVLADLSEPGKQKFGEYYEKGAQHVEDKLANPKTSFVERTKLQTAKNDRDAHIKATYDQLVMLRKKLAEIENPAKATSPPPAKKK